MPTSLVLASSGGLQVVERAGYLPAVHLLVVQLRVVQLVVGGLVEDVGDLLVAVLGGLLAVERVLAVGHGLLGERALQVLPCLGLLKFHGFQLLSPRPRSRGRRIVLPIVRLGAASCGG